MRTPTRREAILVGILFWVLVLSFQTANAESWDNWTDHICDLPGEATPELCTGPYWFLIYEYHEEARWTELLFDERGGFYQRMDCLKFGRFVRNLKFHDNVRYRCIPNKPPGEKNNGSE